jgi:hypothetical protein
LSEVNIGAGRSSSIATMIAFSTILNFKSVDSMIDMASLTHMASGIDLNIVD